MYWGVSTLNNCILLKMKKHNFKYQSTFTCPCFLFLKVHSSLGWENNWGKALKTSKEVALTREDKIKNTLCLKTTNKKSKGAVLLLAVSFCGLYILQRLKMSQCWESALGSVLMTRFEYCIWRPLESKHQKYRTLHKEQHTREFYFCPQQILVHKNVQRKFSTDFTV